MKTLIAPESDVNFGRFLGFVPASGIPMQAKMAHGMGRPGRRPPGVLGITRDRDSTETPAESDRLSQPWLLIRKSDRVLKSSERWKGIAIAPGKDPTTSRMPLHT